MGVCESDGCLFRRTTRKWWERGCSGFDLYTSQETIDEVSRGDTAMAQARWELIQNFGVLEITEDAAELTRHLLGQQIVPMKAASDAIHIAVASVHGLDFLVTWNFKHIANPHIRTRLRAVVAEFGATLPVICTPEELSTDEDD